MVNAFSMLANHGRALTPHLIDYVQDRRGKVLFPKNRKACEGCNTPDWNGRPLPRFAPAGQQLMAPLTATQCVPHRGRLGQSGHTPSHTVPATTYSAPTVTTTRP